MKTANINVLSKKVLNNADAVCFTSNGVIKKNGCLVMGAGVAKQFRDMFINIDSLAGELVKENGNVCQTVYRLAGLEIIAFPTKHHWRNPSNIELIKRSAQQLMEMVEERKWSLVYLPCPGIKNGGLDKKLVLGEIGKILDDRIIVCFYGGK